MADLREGQNNVEIIGTVKKIDLTEKVSKSGKEMIMGDIVVEVKEEGKVNNIKVKILSMKMNKKGEVSGLFKGYKTVKDEWAVGDRARVTGSVSINEYYGQDGELRSFNEVRGLFLNRLEGEDGNKADKAIATVEMVIENMVSELDADSIPTGNLEVEAFSVGYNSKIVPLKNMIIGQALGATFQSMYFPGSTGKITFKINNFAEVTKEESPQQQTGFGAAERVEDNVVTNYTNNLEIIGGDLPYMDGVNNYSPEEIEQAGRNRQLALQELKQQNSAPSEPTKTSGFGNNGSGSDSQAGSKVEDMTSAFTGNSNANTNNNDMPAF